MWIQRCAVRWARRPRQCSCAGQCLAAAAGCCKRCSMCAWPHCSHGGRAVCRRCRGPCEPACWLSRISCWWTHTTWCGTGSGKVHLWLLQPQGLQCLHCLTCSLCLWRHLQSMLRYRRSRQCCRVSRHLLCPVSWATMTRQQRRSQALGNRNQSQQVASTQRQTLAALAAPPSADAGARGPSRSERGNAVQQTVTNLTHPNPVQGVPA